MGKFIKLTQSNLGVEHAHGAPVWINMDLVTELSQCEGTLTHTPEQRSTPIADRPKVTYTHLTFAAGLGEGDVLAAAVQETPEQIFDLLDDAQINDAAQVRVINNLVSEMDLTS